MMPRSKNKKLFDEFIHGLLEFLLIKERQARLTKPTVGNYTLRNQYSAPSNEDQFSGAPNSGFGSLQTGEFTPKLDIGTIAL